MALHRDTRMVVDAVMASTAIRGLTLSDADLAALKRDVSQRLDKGQPVDHVVRWAASTIDAFQ